MLKLRDFFHLPQVDGLIDQITTSTSGVIVVAGLDPRLVSHLASQENLLPSGRGTIFGILMDEIMTAHPQASAVVVASHKYAVRIPRQTRRRTEVCLVKSPHTYKECIEDSIHNQPDLLVVDRLSTENASAVFSAGQQGLQVLTQIDTPLHGAAVASHLLDLGLHSQDLSSLRWIISIHRKETLCPKCKLPISSDPDYLANLQANFPKLTNLLTSGFSPKLPKTWAVLPQPNQDTLSSDDVEIKDLPLREGVPTDPDEKTQDEVGTYYRVSACPDCHYTGRRGDIAIFDVFQASKSSQTIFNQSSLLPLEIYILHLASLGHLALEDFLEYESDQLRRSFNILTKTERAFYKTKTALEGKLVELEAANQVLIQRTEALVSLESLGQTLIQSTDLESLAKQVCRRTQELCGVERVILYYQRSPDCVEILAVSGWDQVIDQNQLAVDTVYDTNLSHSPTDYKQVPPGVIVPASQERALQAGLYVPLIAQNQQVGVMIVHSTKKSKFTPGEVALLKTIGNSAALAIQRASLFDQLRQKIAELETAQVDLLQKERLEHEMELARQVQQSVIPRTFPQITGYRFAARYEPARQVGGDFYDVILLDSDHVGFAIADVSDKGLPAALYMALTRSLLLAEARRERSPGSVLVNVNRLLKELGEPNLFVTIFYGVLENKSRHLTYARAGHDRPFLLRDGCTEELTGKGTALAILDAGEYQITENQFQLKPDDRLILYTDGLCDVSSADGEMFDRQHLKLLLEKCTDLPADVLCEQVFRGLTKFRGKAEQFDDMAMLVIEVI